MKNLLRRIRLGALGLSLSLVTPGCSVDRDYGHIKMHATSIQDLKSLETVLEDTEAWTSLIKYYSSVHSLKEQQKELAESYRKAKEEKNVETIHFLSSSKLLYNTVPLARICSDLFRLYLERDPKTMNGKFSQLKYREIKPYVQEFLSEVDIRGISNGDTEFLDYVQNLCTLIILSGIANEKNRIE